MTLLLAVLLLATALWVEQRNDARHGAEVRAATLGDLALLGARLERSSWPTCTLGTDWRRWWLPTQALVRTLAGAATRIVGRHSRSAALSAAPGMAIRHVYPLRGNEKAIGLYLDRHPVQAAAARLARSSREIVVAGPIQLVQGGSALVSRVPVYIGGGSGMLRGSGFGDDRPATAARRGGVARSPPLTTKLPCAARMVVVPMARPSSVAPNCLWAIR